ncbi:C-type lectin domain family 4 member M [Dissostichus eleginoides]|uniref:C-type lectin domain family 4 member M n=1 Tax=Dissostichus eleginoides TaxID=100907 RepID=A0AAD9FEZ0_DISEL|nr:C-type lectin domain family 4 member M [Dissostichus eleginoides]
MEEINDDVETVKPLTPRSATIKEGPRSSERFPRASVLGFGLLSVFLLAVFIGLKVYCHYLEGVAAADLSAVKANLTESLQARDQQLSSMTEERDRLKANLTEKTREVDRLQSLMGKGPRRLLRASVLGLGLLGVFLLAGLIGLAVHSADLSAVKADLTERLQARDQLINQLYVNLTEKTREVDCLRWRKFGCSCYLLSTEKASWEQSRDNCRARGADLVIVDSDEEQVSGDFLRASVLGLGLLGVFLLAGLIGLAVHYHNSVGVAAEHLQASDQLINQLKANLTERLQARDQLINQLKANLTEKTREVDRLQCLMDKGPRRFPPASVLGLGLLGVFLLAGLIGLAVHYHNSVGVAAERLQARDQLINHLNVNLTERLQARDQLINQLKANLTERLQARDQLINQLKANLTERLQARDQLINQLNVNLTERLQARDQLINQLKANLTEKTREVDRLQSLMDKGWRKFGCSCYLLSTEKASWEQSRDNCRARGADLVIVDSYEEQEFITSMIKEQTWIGLNDTNQEGTWKWVDGAPLTLK